MAAHNVLATLFVVAVAAHLVMNWRPLLRHARGLAGRIAPVSRELVVALAITAGLLLLASGPSVAIAWFKLRKRNLGPILDDNGWAVNARARINIPFGASLTAACSGGMASATRSFSE